jgi:hypothetical protein
LASKTGLRRKMNTCTQVQAMLALALIYIHVVL